MTKKDMVLKIAEESGIKQIDVKEVVQRMLDCMTEALAKGETIELRNFGVFKVKVRKARLGRNPKKPEDLYPIPEKRKVVFKSGMIMKKKVR